jgi:hypothetical protein
MTTSSSSNGKKPNPLSPASLSPEDLTDLLEMMSARRAALNAAQTLLDDTYPGLKAEYSMTGFQISGPMTQLNRLKEDFEAFQEKKESK